MRVQAKRGEVVVDFLFKKTQQDNDDIERAFYALNPHVRDAVFTEDCFVVIPEVTKGERSRRVTRIWD
ncbi:hypothetical protein [Vibrio sp. TRT 17S01]|uniref:hypothetical protein n=1 Tax=Vibrio sp. TRT 17S01 TaxID=3418505 RepID=UPI003CF6504D